MGNRKSSMEDLIESCQIFARYNTDATTHCEHDILSVCGLDPQIVSESDKARLEELGFFVGEEYGEPQFHSFRWGSS